MFEEPFDDGSPQAGDSVIDAAPGPVTGVRFVHEGGSASHTVRGTMIAVESMVMHRILRPGLFCGGQAPVTDFSQPNTYAPNDHWPLSGRSWSRNIDGCSARARLFGFRPA